MRWQGWRDEDGLSLIELLIAMMLMTVVMGTVTGSVVHAFGVQRRQLDEIDVLNRSKIAFERMTREIRASNPIMVAQPDRLTVQVTRGNSRKLTTYALSGTTITFQESVIDLSTSVTTTHPTRVLLTGVALSGGETLFAYRDTSGNPPPAPIDSTTVSTVTITVRMPLREATRTHVLTDTLTLRNGGSS